MCFQVLIKLSACLEPEVTAVQGTLLGAGAGVCTQVGLQVVYGRELLVAILTLPFTEHAIFEQLTSDF